MMVLCGYNRLGTVSENLKGKKVITVVIRSIVMVSLVWILFPGKKKRALLHCFQSIAMNESQDFVLQIAPLAA